MNKYQPKDTPPLRYKNAEPIATKFGLVYIKMNKSTGSLLEYQVLRQPHYEVGTLTYDLHTRTWGAWQAYTGDTGSMLVMVNVENLPDRDEAIMALQRKDPLNWGKDSEGVPVRCYTGR